MADLKTYSVIINWDDSDREQGNYAWTGRAPNHDEAEAMARAAMRATGEGSHPFGSLVECSEGAIWAAADLEKALRPIIWQLDRMDGLPPEVEAMIVAGKAALARCEGDGPAWGTLHYDGLAAPDWSQFVTLEIDGCIQEGADEDYVRGGMSDEDAQFWTIYGRMKETGLVVALQDCVSRAEADHVLIEMMRLSGLPGHRVGEPEGQADA